MNGCAFKTELLLMPYTSKHSDHSRNVMKYFKNVRTNASFFPKKCVECALEKIYIPIIYSINSFQMYDYILIFITKNCKYDF